MQLLQPVLVGMRRIYFLVCNFWYIEECKNVVGAKIGDVTFWKRSLSDEGAQSTPHAFHILSVQRAAAAGSHSSLTSCDQCVRLRSSESPARSEKWVTRQIRRRAENVATWLHESRKLRPRAPSKSSWWRERRRSWWFHTWTTPAISTRTRSSVPSTRASPAEAQTSPPPPPSGASSSKATLFLAPLHLWRLNRRLGAMLRQL